MKVNNAYSIYLQNKSPESYDVLGKALLKYIRAIIAKEFGNRFYFLEDVTGDVILNVFSGLPKFQESNETENFARWVYGITYNACVDKLRARGRLKEQRLIGVEPVKESLSRIDRVIMNSFIGKLSKEEKSLMLSLRAGYSLLEIAEKNGEPEGTVRSRWARLLDRMRTLGGGN